LLVARPGFEPRSRGPEPPVIDLYTTGLQILPFQQMVINLSICLRFNVEKIHAIF
jgi:hypothetical protein